MTTSSCHYPIVSIIICNSPLNYKVYVEHFTDNSDEVTDMDCIMFWSISKQRVVKRLKVLSKVCVISATPSGNIVVSGHNNGTITVYNLELGDIGRNFQAHTSTIFTLEVSEDLKLIASGSADKTVKFWSLSGETFIKCLSGFSHWVVKILLRSCDNHKVGKYSGKHILFGMTKDNITLNTWSPCGDVSHPHCRLAEADEPVYSIPLCTGKAYGFRDIFFTPGLHLFGDNLGFVKQMPMFETHTIGDADIVLANANDGQIRKTIHVNKKVRKLLGIGERFALLLLPYVDNRYRNVVVVDLKEKKIIGGFTVPHSRQYTPDFSQIAIGDTAWLNGLSEDTAQSKVLLTLATNYEHLHLVHWEKD